ncbi:unnamed protein product, partial [Prorocentrum cordatum]
MSYGKQKLIWPLAAQRWPQLKTKSKRNFSDIPSAVLQPPAQEVQVDMGNLFDCSGDISESDKREIEQRKLAFASAAKDAARAAFAAAAEKLRQQQKDQQGFTARLQKKRKGPRLKQRLLLASAPRLAAPSKGFSHCVYMHNLSTWGPRLRKRISNGTDDIFIFSETHVGADGINEILGHLNGKGWTAIVTPSRRSYRAGQAGGVGMAAKAHLSVQSLRHPAAKKEQAVGLRLLDADWSPGPIGFQNQMKMARLAALVRRHDGPWVAVGDWNAEPSEIKQAGWLKVLGGVVRTPEDVQYTCTRSTARMLDYAICSESFQRMIARVVSDQMDPGDHYGVRIHIRGETGSALQRMFVLPKPLPLPGAPKRRADPNSKGGMQKEKDRQLRGVNEGIACAEENAVGVENFAAVRCSDAPVECRRVGQEMGDLFGGYESSVEDDEVSDYGEKKVGKETKQSADEVFDIPEAQRGEIWQLKIGQAYGGDRRAWRTPPSYIADSAADQFDPFGAKGLGAQCTRRASVVNTCGSASERWSAPYRAGGVKMTSKQKRKWRTILAEVHSLNTDQLQALGAAALATARKGKRAEVNEALIAHTNWAQERGAVGSGKLHRRTRDKPRCDNEVRTSDWTATNMVEYMDAKGAQWRKKWTSSYARAVVLDKLGGAGGDRAIGLLSEVMKIWSKIRSQYTNEWASHMAGKWDAAIAGNSALKEASDRSFADEVLEWAPMKVFTVTALWDLAEFCDMLEPLLILEEGLRLGLPARTLHLEMLNHLSTRLVRERTAYAEPISPDRSICAGARRDIDFGRVALYATLEQACAKYQQVYVRSWVDDVTTRMEGSRREVIKQLTGAGVGFAAGPRKARLTLSSKPTLIGNDMDVVKEVAPRLRSRNIAVKVKGQAPDLGIDRGHSIGGGKGKHTKRAAHANRQVAKPLNMARSGGRARGGARQVVQRGALPRAAYACKVFGMAPSTVTKRRRRVASVVAPRLRGRCLTTLLQLEIGVDDPAFGTVFALLGSWMHIVSDPQRRKKVRIVWPRIVSAMLKKKPQHRWRGVTGITRAMVVTLLDLEWQPLGPWHWVSKEGEVFGGDDEHALDDDVDLSDLKAAIKSTIEVKQWALAAQHFAGGGQEGGADLRSAKMKTGKFRRKGQHDKESAFLAIMTGGAWPRQRVADLGIEIEDVMCPRCGEEPETWKHRVWECRCNETIEGIEKSQHIVARASTEVENQPCLWLRGLLPASWTSVNGPPEPGAELIENFGDLQVLSSSAESMADGWLVAAGDASGGEYSKDPRLRRVSSGWVVFNSVDPTEAKVVAGSRGALAGKRHSVNRGELMALKDVIIAAGGSYDKTRYTADSSYVVRGMDKLRGGRMPRTHVDLWKEVKQGIIGKQVEITKVESHMSAQEALDAEVNPIDWLGNALAGDFVDGIAESVQVPRAQARSAGFAEGVAGLVRDRAYLTLMASMGAEPSQVPSLKIRQEAHVKARWRAALLEGTKHNVTDDVSGKHCRCLRCGPRALMPSADAWLAGECIAVQKADAVHDSLRSRPRIANQEAHESHVVLYVEELGLHYCKKCGCIARESMRKLAQVCEETPSQMGKQSLSGIAKGLQPGTSAMALAFNK